jgi:hypothetical protein
MAKGKPEVLKKPVMDRTPIPDHLSAKGAAEMAERIEAYWHRRGYAVRCRIAKVMTRDRRGQDHESLSVWSVRSDMLGGSPTRLVTMACLLAAGLAFLLTSGASAQQPATLAVTIGAPSAPATSVVDTRPVIPCQARPGFIAASMSGEVQRLEDCWGRHFRLRNSGA